MGLFSGVGLFLRDYGIQILAHTQCPYLKVTFSDQVTRVFPFQLTLSAATVQIIGTSQPEEITDPAEGVANEM